MTKLSSHDLVLLVQSVFPRHTEDKALGILIDVPRKQHHDNPDWKKRRSLAEEWSRALGEHVEDMSLEDIRLVAFPDVGSNNADLPEEVTLISGALPPTADGLESAGNNIALERLFRETQLFLAPTEFSATAPLKNAAMRFGFRAATMPGFSELMIPALKIDYGEVSRRVSLLKEKLDAAVNAEIVFTVDESSTYTMIFDLRWREAHLSSGRFPSKGTAGNLPSGETYIVPYEGERGEASETHGILPVQIESECILFSVEANRAREVGGDGPGAMKERAHLEREPAYGNMAELGFGVLGDFGLAPIGEILLDEKLGLHIAFGRSDHFGGQVGPKDFSSPREVIHLDRIYIPAVQPKIRVTSVMFGFPSSPPEKIIEDGVYLIF